MAPTSLAWAIAASGTKQLQTSHLSVRSKSSTINSRTIQIQHPDKSNQICEFLALSFWGQFIFFIGPTQESRPLSAPRLSHALEDLKDTIHCTMNETEAVQYLDSLIGQTLRVHTTDTRIFVGVFKCTDAVSGTNTKETW